MPAHGASLAIDLAQRAHRRAQWNNLHCDGRDLGCCAQPKHLTVADRHRIGLGCLGMDCACRGDHIRPLSRRSGHNSERLEHPILVHAARIEQKSDTFPTPDRREQSSGD